MLFVDVKTNDIQYTPMNLIDLEVAASVTKTVDKTTVKTLDVFTYTINASFSGLTGSIVGAQVKDFIPSYLNYFLPPIQAPLINIIETPVAGGTELTFDFGTITDTGISIVITLGASFKQGTPNGQVFTNTIDQYVNGSIVNTTTAPPVTLSLVPNWAITKYILSPASGQATPGSTVTYSLVLTNTGDPGAVATNIVVTDTLPAGLTPDLSFTPTGIDVSNVDPNVIGLTGSWSGNTMTFNVPSYYGTNYKISYRAIVDPNATIGQTITNTGNLSINGTGYPSSSSTLTIANATTSASISKYGAEHAYPGAYVTYPIYFTNTGNQALTNAVLIDTIPPEIIVKQVTPGTICSPSECPPSTITISYELNNSGTYILLGSYPNVAYQRIDLPPITPPDKITSIKWEFPTVPISGGSATYEGQRITGIIDPTTTATSTINVVTLTADGLAPVSASITTLLDGKNTPSVEKGNIPTTNVVPGQNILYTLSAFNYWGPYIEPIYADLLPPEVDYADNVLYRFYYAPTNQVIYSTDPNFVNFLQPLPPEVIPNYMSTGRTLVRFKFAPGTVITHESYLQIDFNVKVKVGATGTIVNNGVFGDPGDNMISTHAQATQVDTLDLDGDGNTTELLLVSNNVTNGINFSTSLASDKKVKGALDTAYTEWPNVGLTTAGGTIDYKLTVTNTGNVNLESFEIVDILPHIGDTGVILNTTPRGSQFTVYQISAVNATLSPVFPGDPTPILNLDYSTSYDPIRFSETDTTGNSIGTGTWQTTVPVPITSTASFKITSVNTKLKPGQSIVIDIVCIAPLGAPTDLVAWNSFALRGSYLDQSGNLAYLLPVEPQQVGVKIQPQAPTVAALGDYVWYDTNGNGIQDPGEPGINGIVVNLYDSTGTVLLGTTVTAPDFNANDGFYQFGNLQPGCYFVEFIKPNNTFAFSPKGQGTDPTKDSNVNPATGFTDQVCLVAGEYNDTIDAGLTQNVQAFIGNLVWDDLNHNGIQDPGEPGVGNVTVNLLDTNGNVIKTTTTDPTGNYFFSVTPGCYFVEFVKPAGYVFTLQNAGSDDTIDSDADPVTGITPQVCVVASEVNNTIDAGIYVPEKAHLGDFVWNDLNANGIQDAGEPGIPGVTVQLLDSNGNVIATTTTDANGLYNFDVDAGCYSVKFIKPIGYNFTLQNIGSDPAINSNADPITGIAPQVCVTAGQTDLTIDAGLYQMASIGDFVWNDLNQNGLQDAGEPGVAGVTVNLLDNTTGAILQTTTTDANGKYLFNVTPGCYKVEVIKPTGYVFTLQNVGSDPAINSNVDPLTGITPQVCVTSGQSDLTIDAGIYVPAKASLGDFVWNDLNGNGIQDPGEPGVPGVVVNLLDSNGNVIATTTTDANGLYNFSVDAGCYSVAFVKPANSTFTIQGAGSDPTKDSNANPTTGITPQVCVTAGQIDLTLDAGLIFPASIGDFVWNDLNANGIQDAGEPGIPGVTVNLLDNTTGAILQTTTTDANGKYLFNVTPGCYKVAFVKPAGYVFTLQNVGSDPAINSNADPVTGITPQVCVNSGQNDLTIDAGLYQMASIGDFVWNDLNQNGLQDAGEPGVAGVTVNLLDNTTGAILQTTTTDANGKYLFNVTPGCYKVEVIKPTGYVFTLQNVGSDPAINSNVDPLTGITPQVCVTSGQSDLTIDAGIYVPAKASLGDFVWNDLNGNGIQDPGEPGVPGVVVNLLDSNGNVIATTTTDANGLYNFSVDAGCYSVAFVKPANSTFTIQGAGSDPTKDSNANPATGVTPQVCVTSGQVDLTLDAGLIFPASIGDFVWNDLNANGIQDAGEPGIPGVTVNLLDNTTGAILQTTTTDANGKYLFNVDPGCYKVAFIKPTGYVFTLQNVGSDPAINSNADPVTGITPQVCVTSGQSDLTIDAGLYQMASIGDFVWNDLNQNGLQDAGEPGVAGVTVNLLDNTTGAILQTTTTDANGKYLFNVTPGCYKVEVIKPTGYVFTLQNVGSDPAINSNVDPLSGITPQVCVTSGQSDLTIDAGIYVPAKASLGDFVWNDLNGNGIQDPGEPGVPGVVVNLLDSNGNVIATTTTDANGLYNFDIDAGCYSVAFVKPANSTFTIQGAGSDPTKDSNANPATGVTPQVCVTSGQVDLTLDAGLIFPASIGDFVWNDLNGNGLQDAGEPGIPGVTVNLLDNTTGAVLQTTTTDANGKYLFNVAPGCYKVAFVKPAGYVFTLQNVGSDPAINSNADPVTGITPQVCVNSGQNDLTIDAGLYQMASIGDFVWNDLNHNGLQDAGEPGVAGVTVNLLNNTTGAILQTTTTDANGKYLFNVAPGCYKVAFIKPSGYNFTLQNVGSDPAINSNADPVTGITPQVCVTSGQSDLTIDAGLYQMASIGDFVWNDLNHNGLQDAGEPGIPGVTVNLLDATTGAVLQTTTTDANGKYLFAVTPGCYEVAFVKPSGYNFTLQNVGSDPAINSNADPVTGITPQVCVTSGQSDLTIDAGLYQMASIGDFVWNDLNGNGLQDAGEPGIPGVTVNLLDSTTGTILQTTTTDANGKYLFNVAPGCYKVAFVKPTGYNFTLQNVGSDPAINSNADPVTGITPQVCVTSGQNDLTIDAGLTQPASIGDFVWNDLNGNGLQDVGEPGIAGVTVNLLDNATGAILQTTTTDANGKYLFNVNPGCYKVAFVKPTGYVFTLQNVGSNPAINSNPNPITGITPQVCVTSGQSDLTIDAGLYRPALLGDYVWEDLNMNGIQDPGEPGFYNATVNLLNSSGQIIATTKTDSNGNYLFAVAPGCYSIQVIRPNGYMFTIQNAGTDPTKLSAVNPTTGITAQVCLESGQQNLNLDAGIYLIPCDFRQAVNDLIESVALEETGLAHIINAEGEKIQAAMALKFSEADLLNINSSVAETLKIISKLEILLQYKLEITDGICPK